MKRLLCVLMALVMMALLMPTIAGADEPTQIQCPCCGGVAYEYSDSGEYDDGTTLVKYEVYGEWCESCCYHSHVYIENGEVVETSSSSCNWSSWETIKEPTETEPGVEERTCPGIEGYRKSHKQTREIPPTGKEEEPHIHAEEWVPGRPATCTRTGLTDGVKCKWCGEVLVAQKEIPKNDHVYSMWVPNGLGKHYATCQNNCGYKIDAECQTVQLPIKNASGVAISLCPVCGACEGATATAVKGLKVGEGAPYRGTLRVWSIQADENNKYLAVSFDRFGKVMQPEGEVSITLPAELKGTAAGIVGADGNVTSVQESDGTLKLDFGSTQVIVLKGN